MPGSPKISIVMPTRNRSRLIRQAIQSCLDQTCGDFELIIVDDASTDGTAERVRSIADPRILYLPQTVQQGQMNCLNAGFARARGGYFTWISDDDYYGPQALSVMAGVLDNDPALDFVYTGYAMVDEQGGFLRKGRVEDPSWLDRDNGVGHCFLYRRRVRDIVGPYDPQHFLVEDYHYWLRVRQKNLSMKKVDRELMFHRMHDASITVSHGVRNMEDALVRARRFFIPAWKHYYLTGELCYHRGEKCRAFFLEALSLVLNPLNRESWRALALALFPPGMTNWIRGAVGRKSSAQ